MSLPLLIRQIFADLIINGPHQNFRFRSEASGVFHLKNEFEITDLIPSIMDFKIGDVKHNAFTFRYTGNTDYSKNELGLYVVKNSVLDTTPVFIINQDTKEFTFIGKAYFTKDDGTKALIGTGDSGSGGITLSQLNNILAAKTWTSSQITDFNAAVGDYLNTAISGLASQQWVIDKEYINNSALTNYVTSTSLTTTLNGYVTSAEFNTYKNTQSSNSSAFDSSLYSQVDAIGTKINAYYKNLNYRLRYIYNNLTLFEDYISFRIPTEVGFGTGYSFTDSSNYEWSFRERNSSTSTPLLQFKTTAGVKSIVAPYKIQASGWTAVSSTDLITKGSVDTAINSSDPVGTIKLFIKHATAGLQLPSGYLQCNGSTINSTTYPDLFLAMGSTTLPNLVASAPSGTSYIIKALKTSS